MQRRNFIKVMAVGSCFALLPIGFSGCGSQQETGLKLVEQNTNDIRLHLLSYAMLAPNSHNIQPWLVKLTEKEAFDLYVDQNRLLPMTDPPARQIHISQGTLLEGLVIAASNFGYRVDINLFPKGMYSNQTIENKPVASVRIIKDPSIKKDPLFAFLRSRQSNKRYYEEKRVPQSALDNLHALVNPGQMEFVTTQSTDLQKKLATMVGEGMAIEVADRERNKETADLFRFNEEEAEKYRDGFTVANSGKTGFMRFLVEKFFLGTREEAYSPDSAFSKESVKMTLEQAKSTPAYGWIVTKENSRLDQVQVGRLYMRINLITEKLGIAQHPVSQFLQEYEDMSDLQKRFKKLINVPPSGTVQMFFRLGYADPVPHTKRLRLKDVIRS